MALRDKMRESVQPFLAPGETVTQVIGAQTASAWVAALAGVLIFLGLNRYRIIAVTSHRILVLDAGPMNVKKAKSVLLELPRATRLGPPSGVWYPLHVGGEKLRIHFRFFKDIEAADAVFASR